jgi:putative addiction module component (TIGR02574 family)
MFDASDLLAAALALSSDERAELADRLFESLGEPDRREADQAWSAEVEARLQAYRQGLLSAVPAHQILGLVERAP